MKNNKNVRNSDPWDRDFYETGSTRPPKDRGGVIAVLLIMVILLGSLCSALGIINLHLLEQIAQQPPNPDTMNVFDSEPEYSALSPIGESTDAVLISRMGLQGQSVSDFDRQFYGLPQGFLITAVHDDSCSQAAGLHAGDVITRLGENPIENQEDLAQVLASLPENCTVVAEFYRHQTKTHMTATVTLPEE